MNDHGLLSFACNGLHTSQFVVQAMAMIHQETKVLHP
jgi:hypothetical protein